MKRNEAEYLVDIGINFDEVNINGAKDFYLEGEIADIGDLSVFAGYDEIDLTGYSVQPGKTKQEIFQSIEELEKLNPAELYDQGYTNVILTKENFHEEYSYSHFPFNILLSDKINLENSIRTEESANFIIQKDGKVRFAVINGFISDIHNLESWNGNSIIYEK
jgi:hypothetical protein